VAAVLAFKLLQAFARKYRNEKELFEYLDLVGGSVASDIVPINGENRILTSFGLRKLNQNPRTRFKGL